LAGKVVSLGIEKERQDAEREREAEGEDDKSQGKGKGAAEGHGGGGDGCCLSKTRVGENGRKGEVMTTRLRRALDATAIGEWRTASPSNSLDLHAPGEERRGGDGEEKHLAMMLME
jgi:hypothetical protein